MKYRPEIDGLRAIAVIPVILFHAAIPGLSGGFVGVDIFFVISGFLITNIIFMEMEGSNEFSLVRFYERRARRILPALFAMLAVSTMAAYVILLPMELWEYGKNSLAANETLKRLLSASTFIDLWPLNCDAPQSCAPFTPTGELMSADGSHLTSAGARHLGGLIFSQTPLNAYLAASTSVAP